MEIDKFTKYCDTARMGRRIDAVMKLISKGVLRHRVSYPILSGGYRVEDNTYSVSDDYDHYHGSFVIYDGVIWETYYGTFDLSIKDQTNCEMSIVFSDDKREFKFEFDIVE